MKIRAKGTPEWNNFDHCVIAISMGSRNHTGAALKAIIDFVNQANYKSCTIDLSDTLHRYDFMIDEGMNEILALEKCISLGNQWLNVNKAYLDSLKIPFTIQRWDHLLFDPRYPGTRAMFDAAFQNQEVFRTAVMRDVQGYFERQKRKGVNQDTPTNIRYATNYLLEEMTCHTLMYGNLSQTAATLYPGREQSCYALARAGLIGHVPDGLTKSYFVRLNMWEHIKDISYNAKTKEVASRNHLLQ